MPTYLAERGLGERSSGPYAPVCLFRVRRLTQTLTSARSFPRPTLALGKTDAANGCLVARTLSTTQTRTELRQRSERTRCGPQGDPVAWRPAVVSWDAASDELYASYPFSAASQDTTALVLWLQRVTRTSPRFPGKARADRLLCPLISTYHGCPHLGGPSYSRRIRRPCSEAAKAGWLCDR